MRSPRDAGLEMLRAGRQCVRRRHRGVGVLSVVEPVSSGLGGGGFFLLHDARSGTRRVRRRARDRAGSRPRPRPSSTRRATSTATARRTARGRRAFPGLPAALVHLAQKYGKLPLSTSLAPAIRIAREGFPVYARLEKGYAGRRTVMERYPGTRAVFLADGDPPKVGELFRQPDLAHTLELIAARGFDGFYRGETAHEAAGGGEGRRRPLDAGGTRRLPRARARTAPLRLPRLARHHRAAAVVGRRGAGRNPADPSRAGIWRSSTRAHRTHLLIEAMRRAYRDRTHLPRRSGLREGADVAADVSPTTPPACARRSTPSKATPSDLLPASPRRWRTTRPRISRSWMRTATSCPPRRR